MHRPGSIHWAQENSVECSRAGVLCAGQLMAVGVVDVLPRCLSSAYLFWDPDLSWLGLGKLSALKEIAFVQAARSICPSLCWYHMVSLTRLSMLLSGAQSFACKPVRDRGFEP